ncbi:enoyl-CoA hydratase [Sediminicoccus sp. KRV36]|uniref:enoyl-CoA hydratase n=1 Tax=Sediminicoccus sp. KRV36 TaxID=3133721 RepID=UPI00200C563B|nr:enoyl-CoA hydratase [Sediminicoccus rosea]UPY38489.1 enoyl-CoA hydratase/isomerase family protein [Sediminicoccus rosea]
MKIEITCEGDVRRVTVANHAKLNTLNSELLLQLAASFDVEPEIRAVVLTGEGERAFIGGADIREMGAVTTPGQGQAFIERVHGACAAIRACRVPVIARIQGWCLGAGLEIAAACDLRVAATGAKFGMPEVRVGIPSVVEAALLPGLIGWGRTRRLLLLAETLDAATMESWGFLERVVPVHALDGAVAEWVALLTEAGPVAIANQKALIRQWEDLPMSQAIAAGIPAFAKSWETEEPGAMMGHFLSRKR